MLSWSRGSIDRIPRAAHGVYAFWSRDTAKCIYVGQAPRQSIRNRLRDHWRDSHNETLRLWIRAFGEYLDVCYMYVDPSDIDCFERRLITLWRPEANEQHNR